MWTCYIRKGCYISNLKVLGHTCNFRKNEFPTKCYWFLLFLWCDFKDFVEFSLTFQFESATTFVAWDSFLPNKLNTVIHMLNKEKMKDNNSPILYVMIIKIWNTESIRKV